MAALGVSSGSMNQGKKVHVNIHLENSSLHITNRNFKSRNFFIGHRLLRCFLEEKSNLGKLME